MYRNTSSESLAITMATQLTGRGKIQKMLISKESIQVRTIRYVHISALVYALCEAAKKWSKI
jgi:hypothetical protein